jgi:hypothetical protein
VTEAAEFDTVTDEIGKWSSLSDDECQRFVEDGVLTEFEMMCQLRVLFPLYFFVFKQTVSHLAAEANVEHVFSRAGQLSEVNLDPDTLADMVSIMVNKHAYKPSPKTSWTSTMRCSVGGIIQTKQTFSTVPRTRTQMRELDLEVGC